MAWGKRYHWVSRTAGRLPFTPSKVEIKANGHVRDRLHALLDFHVEIETAAFPSQVLFPDTDWAEYTVEGRPWKLLWVAQPGSFSPLAPPHCNTTLALACQRVAPTAARAVSVEHLWCLSPHTGLTTGTGACWSCFPFATGAASFWAKQGMDERRRSLLKEVGICSTLFRGTGQDACLG
ncbi:hypothetical protein V8C44DRAFT_343434 [Trichoderma aethiopicum]